MSILETFGPYQKVIMLAQYALRDDAPTATPDATVPPPLPPV